MQNTINKIKESRPKRGDRWTDAPKATTRSFRIQEAAFSRLKELAEKYDCSQSVLIEALIDSLNREAKK